MVLMLIIIFKVVVSFVSR